ncbi:MAG: UDP-N-acetylglucosamine 2-epimerase (non-hydrolyzing) [Sphingomonadales bacterium]|jgi:UDP-N-acetylglucosamine 2-epimerase (non-hydrolysing)
MAKKVHLIAAARPNFMKVAPLFHALNAADDFTPVLIHTGQHYDANMSDSFFQDLELPKPHYHLGVGSGTHAEQTGGVMIAYEKICMEDKPDWIIVVGDVNSTAACAMVGTKCWVPVAHLEAGLRSRDRKMPEEINRLVTDAIADVLWTPSPDADENLALEGVDPARVTRVGNIMMDSFELMRDKIEASNALETYELESRSYGIVTLHRPSNVDKRAKLEQITSQLKAAAAKCPLIFPVHPRTRKQLETFGLWDDLNNASGVKLVEPISYRPFMSLVANARFALTDSGGIQEETTYLDVPCLTLRDNTERPITLEQGTNRLIKPDMILSSVEDVLKGNWQHGIRPEFWDGHTAARILEDLRKRS